MLCPSCHAEQSAELTTCLSCGTPLTSQSPLSAEKTVLQDAPDDPATSPDESMPAIADVSTNIYDVDHSTDKQPLIDNALAEGDVLQSTQAYAEVSTLKVAAVKGYPPAHALPAQLLVQAKDRTAPLPDPLQVPATGTGTHRKRLAISTVLIVLLIVFAALLVLENGGFIVYGTVFLPDQTNAQATTLARPLVTVQTQATSSAQQIATSQTEMTPLAQQFSQAQDQLKQQPDIIYSQATSGIKIFNDPLNNPNTSLWSAQQFEGGGNCAFSNGAYHAISYSVDTFTDCDLPTTLKDFAFQVQMTIIAGDAGGLLFHSNLNANQYYFLEMDAANGDYSLSLYKDDNPSHYHILQSGFMPTFKTGTNQANIVTIIVKGSTIYLFVNKQFAFSFIDNEYPSGTLSLLAIENKTVTNVAFNNAQLWLLLN